MPDLAGLRRQRLDQVRMGMTKGIDRDARGEIEIALAIRSPATRPRLARTARARI